MCCTRGERPLGVAILAISYIIGALIIFALAVVVLKLGQSSEPDLFKFVVVFAVIAALGGIIQLVLAYGVWNGKGWAWSLLVFSSKAGIMMGFLFFTLGIFLPISRSFFDLIDTHYIYLATAIISALIFYYITRPHVKAFFGKSGKAAFEIKI